MRTTVKASGTAANSAASPAAATATWTASLVATPAVASSPARGPPRMPQPRMNSMSGPGVIIATAVVARKARSRCGSTGMTRSSHGATPGRTGLLEAFERRGVPERACLLRGVRGEGACLEMGRPNRIRRRDGHCGREYEAEPEVIDGISEQDDQTVAEYIRRGEGRVHQGRTDTGALVCGQHAERAEAERDAPVVADAGRATADVTDDLALVAGHERQDQVAVRTQVVHQPGLCGLPERGGVQGVDGRRIGGLFASDEHRPQVCRAAPRDGNRFPRPGRGRLSSSAV